MQILHIYTRVSTATQESDGTSLSTQRELGIAKAKELGMRYQVWNEGGASSHHEDLQNRPVLMGLMKEIEDGNVKNVFVYNNDRLSRNEVAQQTIRLSFLKNEVILYTKDGKFDLSNPSDKLLKSLLDAIAQYDNELRAIRTSEGKLNRHKQGFWYGAPAPFGYKLVDHKLVENPEESKWVKKIFEWYALGKSPKEIKVQLDAHGVLGRRGGLFSIGSITRLMQNTHYIGHYTYKNIEAQCDPIIDVTVWERVHSRRTKLAERSRQNNRTQRFYLLRDLMFCGHCGSKISGRIKESKNERLYYCPNKERGWVNKQLKEGTKWKRGVNGDHGCDMVRSLSIPLADEMVTDVVLKVVTDSSLLKEEFKKVALSQKVETEDQLQKEIATQTRYLRKVQKEYKDINSSLVELETKNLLKEYDGDTYSQIKKKIDEKLLEKKVQIENARIRLSEISQEAQWLDWVAKYADDIELKRDYTPSELKEYLSGIVTRIDVHFDKETSTHRLDLKFRLNLVDDGIKYKDPGNKRKGYKVVEGDDEQSLWVNQKRRGRPKKVNAP